MRPAYVIITIVLVVVPLFAVSVWWALRKRKIYQRLLQAVAEKGVTIDPLATFASGGHTWLSRDENGKTLVFIPENLKISGKYRFKDVVFLDSGDLRGFSVNVDNRVFTGRELESADINAALFAGYETEAASKEEQAALPVLKRLELNLEDNTGKQYNLLLAAKSGVAHAIKSRLVDWVVFLSQALAENKRAQ